MTDPGKYGLSKATVLERDSSGRIVFVVDRKSRFIMKDAEKLMEKAKKIREIENEISFSLKISAPLCSKSKAFLEENGFIVNKVD